jgi:DNA-binding PadR family transcriptional regulator
MDRCGAWCQQLLRLKRVTFDGERPSAVALRCKGVPLLTRYLTQLLKGNTDVLILALLEREPMYGSQILERLEASSGGALRLSEGTLYPALHRLAREGLVRSRWSKLATGKERKFYALTRKGERRLAECRKTWDIFSSAMTHVAGPAT